MSKVLDFVEKRSQNIEEKRQGFERILFRNILGTYTLLDNEGTIYPVKLIDVSRSGCMFEIPWNHKKDKRYEKEEEIKMRMYFSEKSFIPVLVKIKYSMEKIEGGGKAFMRYGCEFDKSLTSFKALESFIDFLYNFAEYSTVDHNEIKSYFV
ncbi:MAG: PilZ domain-containing protein [Bacteriovoracaceae bacterium]